MRNSQSGRSGVKVILLLADALVLAAAWIPMLMLDNEALSRRPAEALFVAAAATSFALVIMRYEGLYLSRLCAIRSVEVRLIGRSSLYLGLGLLLFDRAVLAHVDTTISLRETVIGSTITLFGLVFERAIFRAVVRATRSNGALSRDVLIIGCGAHAARLVSLIAAHPDYGMRVVGVVGTLDSAADNGIAALWKGPIERAEEIAATEMVTGVILSATASEHEDISTVVKGLQRRHIHVQIANGIDGFGVARLRQLHLAREPMIYVEQVRPRRLDLLLKRLFDLTVSLAVLLLSAPVALAAALLIKFTSRGPVLFKQTRVGRDGRMFTLYKFRTMVVDAEKMMSALQRSNERSGPLFKMQGDPRVTKVGRVLRMTSIDELPQLLNVLRGEMSLVGPRPALPSEVLEFDLDLRRRETVKPGITGLWQVEARDSPSFDAYRRLDLFYVDNWTLVGDIDIMLDTFEHLVGRLVGTLTRRSPAQAIEAGAPATLHLVTESSRRIS